MPPAMRVFGTVSVSTTSIHGVQRIALKYSAAARISSSVIATAKPVISGVFGLRGSALARRPFLKSYICWMKYSFGKPTTLAFSGRPLPFG